MYTDHMKNSNTVGGLWLLNYFHGRMDYQLVPPLLFFTELQTF